MNSEYYWNKCKEFDSYSIEPKSIRKRWFRNHYIMYQSFGFFSHDYFVCKYDDDVFKYHNRDTSSNICPMSIWYGPFWNEVEAEKFGKELCDLHLKYLTR